MSTSSEKQLPSDGGASSARMVTLDQGRILVRQDYLKLLRRHHLDSFARVMGFTGGRVLKQLGLRSITRLALNEQPGKEVEFFLKRHKPLPWRQRARSWLGFSQPVSPARREWENVLALSGLNIRSLPVVAFGEEGGAGASFLLSTGITEERPVHLFLVERFGVPGGPDAFAHKRLFIQRLAQLARSFHRSGYHHRDFYLSHFFVKEVAGDFELRLIDLQRMGRARAFRRRWLVKDLGALNYSAPECITSTDKLRFYRCYKNIRKLTAGDKRFIKSILRKTERIRTHDSKRKTRKLEANRACRDDGFSL